MKSPGDTTRLSWPAPIRVALGTVVLIAMIHNMVHAQGSGVDYSKFLHASSRHASQACTSCHQRADNNSTPRFPGHSACSGCHLGQFTTPAIPMCMICHSDINSAKPPVRSFPSSFKESFNVNFDHAQHNKGAARPQAGCSACHTGRSAALSIPANITAHTLCYSCHTPTSKAGNGQEIGSCGVCHNSRRYTPTSQTAKSFRLGFSHARHTVREKLDCNDCHRITPAAPQTRQVSSPVGAEHFSDARTTSCASCHNGKKSFGGDLAFKDCRRCHSSTTFRMPM